MSKMKVVRGIALFAICLPVFSLVGCDVGSGDNPADAAYQGDNSCSSETQLATPQQAGDPPLPSPSTVEPVVRIVIEIAPDNSEHDNQDVVFPLDIITSGNVAVDILNISRTSYRDGIQTEAGGFTGVFRYESYHNGEWNRIPLRLDYAFVSEARDYEYGVPVRVSSFPLEVYDFEFIPGRYRAVFDDWYTEFVIE
jgi:hypothetical protein